MLSKVKLLLGITDSLQDPLLSLLIENTESHFKVLTGLASVPGELGFIIAEVVVKRFQRLGSEGMRSEDIGGHKVIYDSSEDFNDYRGVIFKYKQATDAQDFGEGAVMFF